MRLAVFSVGTDTAPRLGMVQSDRVIDLTALAKWPGPILRSVLDLVHLGPDAWRRLADVVASTRGAGRGYGMEEIRWHAPVPRPPKNIFCLGRNYADHARESARARGESVVVPQHPVFFTKAATSVTGPHDPIPLDPSLTEQVDWEAELGVVLGLDGRDIRRADAMRHVFGYTALNDITARDLQQRHLQWFKGKSLDGFCPMGPVVVTADEFGDPQQKRVSLRVNGITKQDGNTSDMIFPIDVIIEVLSRGMTLEAGDIIATGTPEGVGMGRTPPEFLKDGDVVETEVENVGILRNRVQRIPGATDTERPA